MSSLDMPKITAETQEPANLCEQRAQLIVHRLQKTYGSLLEAPRYVVKEDQVLVEVRMKEGETIIGMHVTPDYHRIWGIQGSVAKAVLESIDDELRQTTISAIDDTISEELSGL